ncbi:N-acetylmuramoyl-L-alanine amidase [bacterium]|nr:N-acetylmuramoyl-L-alanine amidase [bacterium]
MQRGHDRYSTGVILVLFGLIAMGASVWAAEQSGIRMEHFRKPEVKNLSTHSEAGALLMPLKPAVAYLGGETTWHGTTRKVVVKGTSGRTAVITLGMPKVLIGRNQFVRIPHLPRLRKGQVVLSPESLVVIWKRIGNQPPIYDPKTAVFKIGKSGQASSATGAMSGPVPQKTSKKTPPIIVVDAGHGGRDPGAIGPSRLKEKTVTLEVATQLAGYLKKRGYKVVMTRNKDVYISLKERAGIANRLKADLFISVHANASRNRKARGSQVFIYNREASSKHAAEAARLENQDANYLEIIKDDLRQGVHETSSINASGFVSQELKKMGLETRRIERAPFYVLAKSHMPSILIETAFISNRSEEQKLRSRAFCRKLAEGIDRGISQYYRERMRAQQ